MKSKRAPFFEVAAGLLLVVIGFILWWWSTQLVWIQIYPQPLEKSLIESMPFAFWAIGVVLVMDGFRRRLKETDKASSKEEWAPHPIMNWGSSGKREVCAGENAINPVTASGHCEIFSNGFEIKKSCGQEIKDHLLWVRSIGTYKSSIASKLSCQQKKVSHIFSRVQLALEYNWR